MRKVSLYFHVGINTVHKTIGKVSSVTQECPGSAYTPSKKKTAIGYTDVFIS